MKKILGLVILCWLLGGCWEKSKVPVSEMLIRNRAYIVGYDGSRRVPLWVYELLTKKNLDKKKVVKRKDFQFNPDPRIPIQLSASLEDYRNSGFDRGHMCPASDAGYNADSYRETFYLSNMTPQNHKLNGGKWAFLEQKVKELAKSHGALHVYTGAMFLSQEEKEGDKQYVKYQVVGKNKVAVPTHYFKVFFSNKGEEVGAYMMPNEDLGESNSIEEFLTTADKVETLAGIVFPFKKK